MPGPGHQLKALPFVADGVGMGAQPEVEGERIGGVVRSCPDCGRPVEANTVTGKPYLMCRSCYDAYVDNAGR